MKKTVLLTLLSVAILSFMAIGQESNNTSSSYNNSQSYSNVSSDYRTPIVSSTNNVISSKTSDGTIEESANEKDGNRSRVTIKIYKKQGEFPIFEVGMIVLMVILASIIYVTKIKKK